MQANIFINSEQTVKALWNMPLLTYVAIGIMEKCVFKDHNRDTDNWDGCI